MEVLREDLVDGLKEAEVLFKGVLRMPTDLLVTPVAKSGHIAPNCPRNQSQRGGGRFGHGGR